MRPGPQNGAARARARGGVAPALLLDVSTPSGDTYFWADRKLAGIAPVIEPANGAATVTYLPWLMGAGSLTYNRSTQTDTGSVTLQNVSGDALYTDFEKIVTRATLEGSLFVLRYFSADLEFAWIEQHGTLTVGDTRGGRVSVNLQQLFAGADDTPEQVVSENCQLVWGEKRCGATGDTECLYTYSSCQVIEHFVGIQTAFETNNPATVANLPTQVINRKRAW